MKKRRRFNWRVSDVIRKVLKTYLEGSARLRGQTFYCSALSGESEYNVTVNCDLTVSCNCQDYDGSGHLGDLNHLPVQSGQPPSPMAEREAFEKVFFGPVARRFREELARGRLPIKTCARCGDLKRVPRSSLATLPNGEIRTGPEPRLPYRGMLLENTVRCNIDCIGCDRQSAALIRLTRQMEFDKLSRMADLVQQLGLQQLFYLNLGEPFLSPNIGQELPLLRSRNPNCRIVVSTNGIVLNNDIRREAALSASNILFSIAGIDDRMLKKYENLGSFEKAYANMKALVEYRNARGLTQPVLEWKYLLFNWNDRRPFINRAIELAREAKVDIISFWPTNNPFFGYSWRYRLGRLNDVGVGCWKGREVDLRNDASPPATAARLAPAQA